MRLAEVDTPALLIDLDAFEDNLARMTRAIADLPVALRPHAKTHKCAQIALRQVAGGAIGQCCQKVSEAESLVAAGIGDVMITNEVIGTQKLRRVAELAGRASISVCCDNGSIVGDLAGAARTAGVRLDVLVEIDIGGGRCGTLPGAPAVAIAQAVAAEPSLRFRGLQAYHNAAQHHADFDARRSAVAVGIGHVSTTRGMLAEAGLTCDTIAGGGTGTFQMEGASGVYTEIQPGSYIFMDAEYAGIRAEGGGPFRDYRHSLFVLTTVMSHSGRFWAVCDAGAKAASADRGMPIVADRTDLTYRAQADEHGILGLGHQSTVELGDRVRLVPSHCDPTVNLHDWYVCYRGDRVEEVWPVTARGHIT